MTLHGQVIAGRRSLPWLIFLHGFSGDCREWQPVGAALDDFPRLYLDLPGHGGSAEISVSSFAQMSELLQLTLNSYNILKYWLVGYSLGGRIAMYHACQRPAGVSGLVVEGGHPGLSDEAERAQRLACDQQWAMRFQKQPLTEVFSDWYQQRVFASLSDTQRAELVALRSQNNGAALAAMLDTTSLARQPDLRAALRAVPFPVHYLHGEFDSKFQALATQVTGCCHAIPAAGHNAHRENPGAVASALAQILRFETKDSL